MSRGADVLMMQSKLGVASAPQWLPRFHHSFVIGAQPRGPIDQPFSLAQLIVITSSSRKSREARPSFTKTFTSVKPHSLQLGSTTERDRQGIPDPFRLDHHLGPTTYKTYYKSTKTTQQSRSPVSTTFSLASVITWASATSAHLPVHPSRPTPKTRIETLLVCVSSPQHRIQTWHSR